MRRIIFPIVTVLSLITPQPITPAARAWTPPAVSLAGWLTVMWGDGLPGSNIMLDPVYILADDTGGSTRLWSTQALTQSPGEIVALNGRRVIVTGERAGAAALRVQSIRLDPQADAPGAAAASAVSGSQPWISIMCKFSDVAAEPKDLAYFQGMYSNAYPGMDHYWREQSFDMIDVVGSDAVGWYTLPKPKSYYVYGSPLQLDFGRAATDCTGVADAAVYFPNYVGINLMFNSNLDGYAWGGSWYLNRDGVGKFYSMTWEPPWGYASVTVIAHEMGHGFGLPHSSGNYGLTYDNRWDVMSDPWTDCAASSHPTYGCLGQHTISYHKDSLGWIPAGQRYVATPGSQATITLEQLAQPQTSNYKIARIPIGGSATHFYTVEARRKVGYDVKLPGQGVIIHEVNTVWLNPAHVVDADNNGNTGDAGAMWTVGETFADTPNGVKVCVISTTSTGFVVTVGLGVAAACTASPNAVYVPLVVN